MFRQYFVCLAARRHPVHGPARATIVSPTQCGATFAGKGGALHELSLKGPAMSSIFSFVLGAVAPLTLVGWLLLAH
jgi:hypothetical protein